MRNRLEQQRASGSRDAFPGMNLTNAAPQTLARHRFVSSAELAEYFSLLPGLTVPFRTRNYLTKKLDFSVADNIVPFTPPLSVLQLSANAPLLLRDSAIGRFGTCSPGWMGSVRSQTLYRTGGIWSDPGADGRVPRSRCRRIGGTIFGAAPFDTPEWIDEKLDRYRELFIEARKEKDCGRRREVSPERNQVGREAMADIKEAARAFTGRRLSGVVSAENPKLFDDGLDSQVLTMILSEFGRRPAEKREQGDRPRHRRTSLRIG